jgi:uncharacterized membrane protein YesL
MKAFTIMGRTFKAAYDELFLCVWLSVLWWIGMLLVVTAAPATVGLNHVANRIANYKRVDASFFWEAARMHIGRGWLLFAIAAGVPLIMIFDAWFFFNTEGLLRTLGVFLLWLFVLSIMIGQYVFPLFWQQDEPDLRLVLRNAALLALRHPLYTFLIVVFQVILLGLSVALTLPLVLLYPALAALTVNHALVGLLQEMGLAPQPPQTPAR